MSQTFLNTNDGRQIKIDIMHTFETKEEMGRNIVVFEDNDELKLGYISGTTLEIINDENKLKKLYDSSMEQLLTIQKDILIEEDNVKKIDNVFNELNLSTILDEIIDEKKALAEERISLSAYIEKKQKDEENLKKLKEQEKDHTGNNNNQYKDLMKKLEEKLENHNRTIAIKETRINILKQNIEAAERQLESLKQQATIKLSKNNSREVFDSLKDILEKRCNNYLNGKKQIDTVDIFFEKNMNTISNNIMRYKSNILKKNSIIGQIESERKNIEDLEKQIEYEVKKDVIEDLKKKYTGEELNKKIHELDEQVIQIDHPKLDEIKNEFKQLLVDSDYNSMIQEKTQEEIKLKLEQEKYDEKVSTMGTNNKQLDEILKKIQLYLGIIQCTNSMIEQKNKLSYDQQDILNQYETLQRKQLSYAYKIEKYEDLLNDSNIIQADKKVYKKIYDTIISKKIKLDEQLQTITTLNSTLISKSIYSNQQICDLLLLEKKCSETNDYLEKFLKRKFFKESIINEKKQEQQRYRDIQRKNIEDNDKEMFEQNVKETSLEAIIKSEKKSNSKIGKVKTKIRTTKLYQKIKKSKFAQGELAIAIKESITNGKIKINSFRQDMNDFMNFAENQNKNDKRR